MTGRSFDHERARPTGGRLATRLRRPAVSAGAARDSVRRQRVRGRLAAIAVALVAVVFLASPRPAAATQEVVDLELVLAVDVSWSMDIEEQVLQRDGYVAAFRHPEVIAAIQSGDWGRIAVTYVEWAGVGLSHVRVPWMIVEGPESALAFAEELAAAPLGRLRRTSISAALDRVGEMFADNGVEGMRRVVDVSGDGPNNMGGPVLEARDRLLAEGVTINGLPIMLDRPGQTSFFQIEDLDLYYEDCVIGGFGSFVIPVRSREGFKDAIRRKLVLEIAALPEGAPPVVRTGGLDTTLPGDAPRIDCLIGEKLWNQWRNGRW